MLAVGVQPASKNSVVESHAVHCWHTVSVPAVHVSSRKPVVAGSHAVQPEHRASASAEHAVSSVLPAGHSVSLYGMACSWGHQSLDT